MSTMRIITWNTNGFFLDESRENNKKEKIIQMVRFSNDIKPIFCIQEAGTTNALIGLQNITLRDEKYHLHISTHYQKEKSRCCLCVAIPNSLDNDFQNAQFDSFQESRPVACMKMVSANVLIANIHTTPKGFDEHNFAGRDIITTIRGLQAKSKKWILVGDMNCEPSELREIITANCKKLLDEIIIIPPIGTTHKSNISGAKKTLDYLIASKNIGGYIQCKGTRQYQVSDHYPVIYDIPTEKLYEIP